MAAKDEPTIVIKKIKKVAGGHHGGAWKVAYADFVTAMMAFFLLLWLLASTSESQKEGIAEYFTPTVGLRDSMGIGFEGGESPSEEGTKKDDLTPVGIIQNSSTPGISPEKDKKEMIEGEMESQLFEQAREEITRAIEQDASLNAFKDQIVVSQTPEGLKIDIQDSDKKPMFQSGTAKMSDFGEQVLAKLAVIIEKMPNYISVTGHTDAEPLNARGGTYTNWELSADRANAARRVLVGEGMEDERVGKVLGLASQELLLPNEPTSERNRRISIILLRGDHFGGSSYIQNRPGSILSVPKANSVLGGGSNSFKLGQ
jgi:chemotaxis protein MotB